MKTKFPDNVNTHQLSQATIFEFYTFNFHGINNATGLVSALKRPTAHITPVGQSLYSVCPSLPLLTLLLIVALVTPGRVACYTLTAAWWPVSGCEPLLSCCDSV